MTKADQLTSGVCEGCGDRSLLIPLHGPKGGPLRCPLCVGKWNAEHTRRRKWGRIIIKAMKMYKKEGGSWSDFDKLKRAAMLGGLLNAPEITLGYGSADTIGAEVPDVTSELLADTLKLTHPDRQPAERKQLAQRVTQELLALQPFVFPAAKPEPAPAPRDTSFKASPQPLKQPSRTAFPCELCADTVPGHYCDACRAEWERRENEKDNRAREKQRRWYAARRQRQKARQRAACLTCGIKIEANRTDARFCSPACRQKHHRRNKGVTAASSSTANFETAVTRKPRKVWKLEQRDGHLWHGDTQVTEDGGPGKNPHGSWGWHRGDWRVSGTALAKLGMYKNYWYPVHRCWDCDGWILAHPNTARCGDCKAVHDAKAATAPQSNRAR